MRRRAAAVTRWLHVYLSMISFAVVLFFAATGLTLNHPDWFVHQQRTIVRHGTLTLSAVTDGKTGDIDKLKLAERLRGSEHVHGTASDVRVDDSQISLSFRAPGYTADIFIDRPSGKYDITEVSNGLVAVLNDLHKGRDSGKTWGYLIDVSAVLLVLVSLSGLILIWFVYKRRVTGLVLAFAGSVIVLLLYLRFVP